MGYRKDSLMYWPKDLNRITIINFIHTTEAQHDFNEDKLNNLIESLID